MTSLSDCALAGDNCKVRDPRTGYEFDLSSLKGRDYQVRNDKYIYHLSVCGGLAREICTHGDASSGPVSSCQADGAKMKIGGIKKLSACIKYFIHLLAVGVYFHLLASLQDWPTNS